MAGLIKREDIDAVRERARIDEVVAEHVTLKPAGVGSLKGLCPFHDERTPSFHVRPQVGMYHCFGCGEGGDVISFVQKINHLTFVEAVETLAGRYGDSGGAGWVRAKTGTLDGTSALAGYTVTEGGDVLTFVMLSNEASLLPARAAADAAAAKLHAIA